MAKATVTEIRSRMRGKCDPPALAPKFDARHSRDWGIAYTLTGPLIYNWFFVHAYQVHGWSSQAGGQCNTSLEKQYHTHVNLLRLLATPLMSQAFLAITPYLNLLGPEWQVAPFADVYSVSGFCG